jgi:hypothetical protein
MRRSLVIALVALAACRSASKPAPAPAADAAPAAPRYDRVPRLELNRWAVRLDLPLYWILDADQDGTMDPAEVATLRFYPTAETWVRSGAFTPELATAYERIVAARAAGDAAPGADASPEAERQALVAQDLDGGRPTLVYSDFSGLSDDEKKFVRLMLDAADMVDELYELQNGAAELAGQLPDHPASRSLFRRNRGPLCVSPKVEQNPRCNALPSLARPVVGVYPAPVQKDPQFCAQLSKRPDAEKLLTPFTVVREQEGKLVAVPYHEAWPEPTKAVAMQLRLAADVLGPDEKPLAEYLRAAAQGFETDDWRAADEAWAKMNAENSKWYVRAAPDEIYWEPCARKAGYHLTFARINRDSLEWQKRLAPALGDMERAVAEKAGAPYKARDVKIHLPDFIDIVVNAGDDRGALGATIGQSLPNWGPVANEGRGRTVAMSNLYTDPDSMAARHEQAASLLDTASMGQYVDDPEPGLLATILHEASHNLGPAHEYAVKGKTDDAIFGGPLAAVFEELKSQTGALFLVELLVQKGILSPEMARQTYTDSVVWALGHVAQGMTTATGERKTYSQVAAIQVGFLLDEGALTWDPDAPAASGTDKGAFTIHLDKVPAASAKMMAVVGGIKARGDRAGAEALVKRYVDGDVVPQATIAERWLRSPKASFVYAVVL